MIVNTFLEGFVKNDRKKVFFALFIENLRFFQKNCKILLQK